LAIVLMTTQPNDSGQSMRNSAIASSKSALVSSPAISPGEYDPRIVEQGLDPCKIDRCCPSGGALCCRAGTSRSTPCARLQKPATPKACIVRVPIIDLARYRWSPSLLSGAKWASRRHGSISYASCAARAVRLPLRPFFTRRSHCFCCFYRKLSAGDIAFAAEILDFRQPGRARNSAPVRCKSM
jgi:hypothetical protein